MKNLYEIKDGIYYSLYLALVICILSPLTIISSNPGTFRLDDILFFGPLIIISGALFILILFPISLAFIFAKKYICFKRIVFSLIVMVTIFALYLPLGYGKLDGVDAINISFINLTLGVLFLIISYFLFSYKKIILPILIIGPLVTSAISVLNEFNPKNNHVLPVSQTEKNIFVISFDALQTNDIKTAIDSLPDKEKVVFEGFVLFDDVMGVGPQTMISTGTTKLGSIEEDKEYQKAFNNQITTKLSENGYNVETMGQFSQKEKSNTNQLSRTIGQLDSSYFNALKASILKIFPYKNNYVDLVEGYFVNLIEGYLGSFFPKNYVEMQQQISLDKHQYAKAKRGVFSVDEFIDKLNTGSTKPTLRMHHYGFTHDPMRLTPDCKFKGANQRVSTLSETQCAINKMMKMIQKIKKLGVYQNSLIFFISDHGHECGWEGKKDVFHINNLRVSKRWCLTRYTPFMMFKPPFQNGPLKESKIPVSLFDIPKTICMASLNDPKQCSIYQGYDLLSSIPPLNSQFRPLLLQKSEKDIRGYEGYYKVKVPRYTTIYDYFNLQNHPLFSIEFLGANLPSHFKNMATREDDRVSFSGSDKGFLTYGPYMTLERGLYQFSVSYRYKNDNQHQAGDVSHWNISASNGKSLRYKKNFTSSPNQFTLDKANIYFPGRAYNVEVSTFYAGSGELEIDKIKISKLPQQPICSETVHFNKETSLSYYNFSNLGSLESWGRWTDGDQAEIEFQTEQDCKAKSVTFNLKAYVNSKNPEQTVSVFINNKSVGNIQIFSDEAQSKQFTFALPNAQDNKYKIRFNINKPTSPKSLGMNNDKRELGFGFIDMRLLLDEVTAQ
jgi:hypothetical protein